MSRLRTPPFASSGDPPRPEWFPVRITAIVPPNTAPGVGVQGYVFQECYIGAGGLIVDVAGGQINTPQTPAITLDGSTLAVGAVGTCQAIARRGPGLAGTTWELFAIGSAPVYVRCVSIAPADDTPIGSGCFLAEILTQNPTFLFGNAVVPPTPGAGTNMAWLTLWSGKPGLPGAPSGIMVTPVLDRIYRVDVGSPVTVGLIPTTLPRVFAIEDRPSAGGAGSFTPIGAPAGTLISSFLPFLTPGKWKLDGSLLFLPSGSAGATWGIYFQDSFSNWYGPASVFVIPTVSQPIFVPFSVMVTVPQNDTINPPITGSQGNGVLPFIYFTPSPGGAMNIITNTAISGW